MLGDLLDVATGTADANLTISAAAEDIINQLAPTPRERQFINAYMSDLYVAPMEKLSLRGMVSDGYSGDHELVMGGFNQVVLALRDGIAPDGTYKKPLADVRLNSNVLKVELPGPGSSSGSTGADGAGTSSAGAAAGAAKGRGRGAYAAAASVVGCLRGDESRPFFHVTSFLRVFFPFLQVFFFFFFFPLLVAPIFF